MNRLSTLSRVLDSQLTLATPAKRLEVVLSVCDQAASEIETPEPLILETIARLHAGQVITGTSQLSALRERLDNAYFEAQEHEEENAQGVKLSLKLFSEARLTAALELVSAISDAEAASDCLYEALMALNDNQVTIRKLELTLN